MKPQLRLTDGRTLDAGKIVCIGQNYADHAREMDPRTGRAQSGSGAPFTFFLKPATAIVHDGEPILLPHEVGRVDHEIELAAALGRPLRATPPDQAMAAVLGYAVFLDITAREVQAEAKKRGLPWDESKGYDTFAPMGAVLPAEEVPDPHALRMELRVNGQLRQRASTTEMMCKIPEALARVSRVMTLLPGDVVAFGTPAGVGPLHPGDLVTAEIERLPSLSCPVRAQPKRT